MPQGLSTMTKDTDMKHHDSSFRNMYATELDLHTRYTAVKIPTLTKNRQERRGTFCNRYRMKKEQWKLLRVFRSWSWPFARQGSRFRQTLPTNCLFVGKVGLQIAIIRGGREGRSVPIKDQHFTTDSWFRRRQIFRLLAGNFLYR